MRIGRPDIFRTELVAAGGLRSCLRCRRRPAVASPTRAHALEPGRWCSPRSSSTRCASSPTTLACCSTRRLETAELAFTALGICPPHRHADRALARAPAPGPILRARRILDRPRAADHRAHRPLHRVARRRLLERHRGARRARRSRRSSRTTYLRRGGRRPGRRRGGAGDGADRATDRHGRRAAARTPASARRGPDRRCVRDRDRDDRGHRGREAAASARSWRTCDRTASPGVLAAALVRRRHGAPDRTSHWRSPSARPRAGWLRGRRVSAGRQRGQIYERRALHVPQAHTPCCQGGVRDFLRGRASDRPHRLRRRRRRQRHHDDFCVGAEADDHARHEELRRGVHPRPALRAGAEGEGLPGHLQGQLRLPRSSPTRRSRAGRSNFYPEYTGVIALDLAKAQNAPKSANATYAVAKKFEDDARSDAAQPDAVRGHDTFTVLTSTAHEGRPEDDERPEQAQVVLVRRAIRSARRGSPASSG